MDKILNEEIMNIMQKQLLIQESIDENIRNLGNILSTTGYKLMPTHQSIENAPELGPERIPDSERIIFYMYEYNIPLSEGVLELIRERASRFKTEIKIARNNEILEGKLALVCYLNSNPNRLDEYPINFINDITASGKTSGNVILIGITPVNNWQKIKKHFSSVDIYELNEKYIKSEQPLITSGLFMNDESRREFMVCRLCASMDRNKSEIYPLDDCDHNRFNIETCIDRSFSKLFEYNN